MSRPLTVMLELVGLLVALWGFIGVQTHTGGGDALVIGVIMIIIGAVGTRRRNKKLQQSP